MKRRKFVAASALAVSAAATPTLARPRTDEQHIIEWREYTCHFRTPVQPLLDYFSSALIPAFNKYGVKNIGVFENDAPATPVKIYLLLSYPSLAAMKEIKQQVATDGAYRKASQSYVNLSPESKPYNRYSTTLMRAFKRLPKVMKPNTGGIFELRSYEGYNEDAVRRKVMMFDDEEIDLFYETKLNPVFFGDVFAGPSMPRLTYMLTFADMAERNRNWDAFIQHPEWKRMVADPKYANTVSDIYQTFLKPMTISQL